jgi:two-component system NtrC family sensor kinase
VSRIGFRAHWPLIAASLLVPLALFGVIAWQDRGALQRDAQEGVDRGADTVREHALKVFDTSAAVIALIDEHIKSMSWAEIAASRELHDYLAELGDRYAEIESVWIADGNGTVQSSSRFFPALSGNVSGFDFFRAARESRSVVFGERVDTDFQNKVVDPHFFLAQRRTSRDGAFDGLIVLTFSSTYFREVWRQSWHNAPEMFTDLTRGDFKVLAREPPSPINQLNLTPPALAALRANPNTGSLRTVSSVDHVDRIASYRRVDPYDAYVIYGVSFASVLRTWLRHLLVYGGIFGLAALGLTAVSLIAARHLGGERIAMRELAAETDKRLTTEQQLFEAEKLDAIGKVAGGFAHDFGNLLMAIQLNLDILGDRVASDAKEALDAIRAEVERGNEAIRSLMIFARRGSVETDIVDAKAPIEQMGRLLQSVIGTHATLELWCEDGLWPIEINPSQLELALLNLAVNARDAMRDGGKIRIAARNVSLTGAPSDLTGDFVEISVSDTGTGMPAEIASLAFDPFFTTKEVGQGTGLGLSQVYGFAKQAGGTATITSAVGQGTKVVIYIPTCAAAATQRKQRMR